MPPGDNDTTPGVDKQPDPKSIARESTRPSHYATWFVSGKSKLSDAERSAAQVALQSEFGSQQKAGSASDSKVDYHPSAPVPFVTRDVRKPVDLVPFLNGVLSELGYSPFGRRAYDDSNEFGFRANRNSPDVDLCVDFIVRGQPAKYLKMGCYLGNRLAEQFVDAQMLMVLPSFYKEMYADSPPWTGVLHRRLAREQGWADGGLLDPYKNSVAEIADRIGAMVRDFIQPGFGSIDSIKALFDFALKGSEPFPWDRRGNPRRVAMVAYLGRRIGVDPKRLKDVLLARVGVFKSPPWTWAPTSGEFLDLVLAHAEEAIAQGK